MRRIDKNIYLLLVLESGVSRGGEGVVVQLYYHLSSWCEKRVSVCVCVYAAFVQGEVRPSLRPLVCQLEAWAPIVGRACRVCRSAPPYPSAVVCLRVDRCQLRQAPHPSLFASSTFHCLATSQGGSFPTFLGVPSVGGVSSCQCLFYCFTPPDSGVPALPLVNSIQSSLSIVRL